MIFRLCSVRAVVLRPKLWVTKYIRGWVVFCTANYAVRTKCSQKNAASYGVLAQTYCVCTSKNCNWRTSGVSVVILLYIFVWSCSFYNIIHAKVVSKHVFMIIITILAHHITLYETISNTYHAITFYGMIKHDQKNSSLLCIAINCKYFWIRPSPKIASHRSSTAYHKKCVLVLAVIIFQSSLPYSLRVPVNNRINII